MGRVGVVILAAGLGKRMKSSLPKVMHPLNGKPLFLHVLTTARRLKPDQGGNHYRPRRREGKADLS